jgi:hypothetical protein
LVQQGRHSSRQPRSTLPLATQQRAAWAALQSQMTLDFNISCGDNLAFDSSSSRSSNSADTNAGRSSTASLSRKLQQASARPSRVPTVPSGDVLVEDLDSGGGAPLHGQRHHRHHHQPSCRAIVTPLREGSREGETGATGDEHAGAPGGSVASSAAAKPSLRERQQQGAFLSTHVAVPVQSLHGEPSSMPRGGGPDPSASRSCPTTQQDEDADGHEGLLDSALCAGMLQGALQAGGIGHAHAAAPSSSGSSSNDDGDGSAVGVLPPLGRSSAAPAVASRQGHPPLAARLAGAAGGLQQAHAWSCGNLMAQGSPSQPATDGGQHRPSTGRHSPAARPQLSFRSTSAHMIPPVSSVRTSMDMR